MEAPDQSVHALVRGGYLRRAEPQARPAPGARDRVGQTTGQQAALPPATIAVCRFSNERGGGGGGGGGLQGMISGSFCQTAAGLL